MGDEVLVVGVPYGLSHSLTTGLISARWLPNTVYRRMPMAEFFQATAVINTGNSGGPMFNMAGEVIGIASLNISKSGGSEGLALGGLPAGSPCAITLLRGGRVLDLTGRVP